MQSKSREVQESRRRLPRAGSLSLDFLTLSFVFIDILALFRRFRHYKPGFTPRRKGRKVPPPPDPSSSEEGCLGNSPTWIRRGQWWLISAPTLCFHRHSRFVPSFSSLQTRFHAKAQRPQSPTTPDPSSSEEGCLGNSPPWIRRGHGWLISAPTLCFHRHSRFVPSFSSLRTRFHAKAQSAQRPQSPTIPDPSSSEEGRLGNSPAWLRRGQGWLISAPTLCFHRHSRFVP